MVTSVAVGAVAGAAITAAVAELVTGVPVVGSAVATGVTITFMNLPKSPNTGV